MKRITVHSKTFGTHIILVSDKDYPAISKFTWSVFKGNSSFYATTSWPLKKGTRTTRTMHRLIMNAKNGEMIDHIDHNGLNNTKSNLRRCTSQENSRNMLRHRDAICKYKGVSYDKKSDKFSARICVDSKTKNLGFFATEVGAAKAYNRAAKQYFVEFAKLNIIENGRNRK